jgi:NMD protein affecting ribosome stability and mRNA decay
MNARDESAMQALSDAGAVCGDCGDQPGDRTCPDCERCRQQYVAALRAAGWGPRAEVLNGAADLIEAEQYRLENRDRSGFPNQDAVEQRDAVHAMANMLRDKATAEAGEPRG